MPLPDHSDKNENLTFNVGSSTYQLSPDPGFQLMSWSIQTATHSRDILYCPDSIETFDGTIMGGNPILFPFSGRSYDRGKEGTWRCPKGNQLPIRIHGFARSCPFRVIEQSDNSITGEMFPTEEAHVAYPFEYLFRVNYQFEELAFKATLTLENRGSQSIPWSAGHHLFFNLPWHADSTRNDYQIQMDPRKCAYHGPDGKLVMEKDRESIHLLSDPVLINRIHWELRHNRITFGPRSGEEDIQIIIGDETHPPRNYSVVTWSPSETAPYYCIEPWMGPPNAAEHGKGLHWVGPGETESFKIEVSLF